MKKDGVPRGAFPAVLMRNLAVGNTYTIIIYVQGGKLEGSESSQKLLKRSEISFVTKGQLKDNGVVCTLGGWAPLFERSWVQFPVSLAK